MYYLFRCAVPVALLIVAGVIVILVIYIVKTCRKKKGHKKVMTDSIHQPLLHPDSVTRRSFYDSIHSWPVTSSIMRAARRFTTSVSIKAFGHTEGMLDLSTFTSTYPYALYVCVGVWVSISVCGHVSHVHKTSSRNTVLLLM